MGEAMRRFWIPILSSSQLPEADGDPVKVEIMGQKMVAFSNTEGVVGLINQQCRHRNASLALGRVEKCGIRCLFHGWLFAPDGTVLKAPTTGFVDKGGNWRVWYLTTNRCDRRVPCIARWPDCAGRRAGGGRRPILSAAGGVRYELETRSTLPPNNSRQRALRMSTVLLPFV
jgi:Phenylpropionate dioxygenase and related ring-hydroxylating dioxygenases, large terminal subunit